MSVARPWWLLALALLLPLILLHLRRPALAVRDVADLAIWERLAGPAESADWRLRRPRHPVLLALQALALSALVLALAGPERRDGAPPATTVYVVDGSLWMHVGTRLADARAGVRQLVGSEPRNDVAVVTATGTPAVAYRGPRSGLEEGLRQRARECAAPATWPRASPSARACSAVAAGAWSCSAHPRPRSRRSRAAPGQVSVRVVGSRTADQGVFARGSRCGIGPAGACEILATVRNESASPRVDRYVAHVDGKPVLTLRVAVPAHGAKTLALTAQPGVAVRLQLAGRDALALDDTAWFDVPSAAGTPAAMTVTLVGDPATAKPLAQALAAAPGVTLNLRTPATYRRRDALASDLVVLAGWLPAGRPAAGARRRAGRAPAAPGRRRDGRARGSRREQHGRGRRPRRRRRSAVAEHRPRRGQAARAAPLARCRHLEPRRSTARRRRQRPSARGGARLRPREIQPDAASGVPDPRAQPRALGGGLDVGRRPRLAQDQLAPGCDARDGHGREGRIAERRPERQGRRRRRTRGGRVHGRRDGPGRRPPPRGDRCDPRRRERPSGRWADRPHRVGADGRAARARAR